MPLKKSASLKENSDRRINDWRAREKAKEKFGEAAVKGKQVHHKNGNEKDNRPSNLELVDKKTHGAKHGRGNGKRGGGTPNNNPKKDSCLGKKGGCKGESSPKPSKKK